MKNTHFAKLFGMAFGMCLPLMSNTAWTADAVTGSSAVQFNAERYFDFSSEQQLSDFVKFGDDPSYWQNGKLIGSIAAGTHKGIGKRYVLEKDGYFTNEVEMSFDIYLDKNFQVNTHPSEIGKFPGMEGIYDTSAGWGGKPVGIENSWSIRIGHLQQDSQGKVPIGLYIYHPEMTSQYGIGVPANFALQTMTTYRITLYVKLNDVGANNGVIRLSVDGDQKYSSSQWKLRLADSVHVKSVWLDAYIGGSTPSPVDTWVALDNLHIKWKKCADAVCASAAIKSPEPPLNIRLDFAN